MASTNTTVKIKSYCIRIMWLHNSEMEHTSNNYFLGSAKRKAFFNPF